MSEGRERVPWAIIAARLVVAGLCEPSSKLPIAEVSYRCTAWADRLGVAEERVNDDRRCRALDPLLPHKAALEGHLTQRPGERFALDYELLLCGVTSTYFEDEAAAIPLARRCRSGDHRRDCKQVCIGLVVTREGIPQSQQCKARRKVYSTPSQIAAKLRALFYHATPERMLFAHHRVSVRHVVHRLELAQMQVAKKRWRN